LASAVFQAVHPLAPVFYMILAVLDSPASTSVKKTIPNALYRVGEPADKIEPFAPFPFGLPSGASPALSHKSICARTIPRPILPFYHIFSKSKTAGMWRTKRREM
jgi:hypothetical protein